MVFIARDNVVDKSTSSPHPLPLSRRERVAKTNLGRYLWALREGALYGIARRAKGQKAGEPDAYRE
jgi:hypothetical protein